MKMKMGPSNLGAVISVRGSVVDIRFNAHLPPIYSLLHAKEGEIAIEVLAQLDAHRVRGIALTPTQGLARGMTVEDTGGPLKVPVGKGTLSRMFDVFGNALDREGEVSNVEWRTVHRAPPSLNRRSTKSEVFETGIKVIDVLVPLELGGGSLTALPIIETEAQNISAYIPTNLISITDGQIYLSPSLFELGVLPAVDVGKSVSRVGGKAQRAAYRAVAGDLKLAYSQFEELETFARFGARLDEDNRKVIEHGRRIRACLKQLEFAPVSVSAQIAVLLALTADLFDSVPLDRMTDAEQVVREAAAKIPEDVGERLDTADKLSDEDRETIIDIARHALEKFSPEPNSKSEPEQGTEKQPKPEAKAER